MGSPIPKRPAPNRAPTVLVNLTPNPPGTDSLLTANVTGADLDGDALTFTYSWRVDGGAPVQVTTDSILTFDTLNLATAGFGDSGQVVSVLVTPFDGTAFGIGTQAQVTVS